MTNAERLADWLESARTAICQSRCNDVRRRFSGGIISSDFAESILRELQAAERLWKAVLEDQAARAAFRVIDVDDSIAGQSWERRDRALSEKRAALAAYQEARGT